MLLLLTLSKCTTLQVAISWLQRVNRIFQRAELFGMSKIEVFMKTYFPILTTTHTHIGSIDEQTWEDVSCCPEGVNVSTWAESMTFSQNLSNTFAHSNYPSCKFLGRWTCSLVVNGLATVDDHTAVTIFLPLSTTVSVLPRRSTAHKCISDSSPGYVQRISGPQPHS